MPGKSPLFEIRQMEAEANSPLKSALMPTKIDHLEQSDLPVNKEKCAEVDFDEEDEDYLPNPIKENRLISSVSKRSSPICVYTCKVKYTSFHFHYFFIIFPFCILWDIVSGFDRLDEMWCPSTGLYKNFRELFNNAPKATGVYCTWQC